MWHIKKNKLLTALLAIFVIQPAFAGGLSIESSSINYDDQSARSKLLASAPKWQPDEMKTLFDAYQHPERYQLEKFKSTWKNNASFINAFWGLKNNPFLKIARPAKVFVFSDTTPSDKDKFVMAPLVQNAVDGQYYVFDANNQAPQLLDSWITKNNTLKGRTIRFNVCNGYADKLADSCDDKTFDDEESDITSRLSSSLRTTAAINASAVRLPNEDWRTKITRTNSRRNENQDDAEENSILWRDLNSRQKLLSTVVTWPNYQVIKDNFIKMRDARYFNDLQKPGFMRRISWLYPDDGCWTRATAMIKDFFGPINNMVNQYARPNKLFVFGNLCVNTPNSRAGKVNWWYHTAPIVRDAQTNQSYVLDPSVNPKEPMTVEDWMNLVASTNGKCKNDNASVSKFNVCNQYGTTPNDACRSKTDGFSNEMRTELMQHSYQQAERSRQVELGRDADKVLGDLPPWNN